MNDNIYFEGIENIGNLYLKCILWEFDYEPVIFICSDDKGDIFLCMYSESEEEQNWIIVPTQYSIIDDLVEQKIDLLTAISDDAAPKWMVTQNVDGSEINNLIKLEDIDPLILPKEGTFLKYYNEIEVKEFLKDFNNLKLYSAYIVNNEDYKKTKEIFSITLDSIVNETFPQGFIVADNKVKTNYNKFNDYNELIEVA